MQTDLNRQNNCSRNDHEGTLKGKETKLPYSYMHI